MQLMRLARSASDRSAMKTNPLDTSEVVETLRERKQIGDAGVSEKTPWILLGETWVVIAAAVLVVLAISLLAYRLAT
jgi:hypothetical protein